EGAVVRYQRAVELRPDMADARVNLAKAYEALNRTGEALTEYRQAVMLRPYHFDTYRRLGALLYGSNRLDEAADVYRRWLSLDPESPVARHLIAACTGQDGPRRASEDTVRTMFKSFAESFDEVLARIQYGGPALVAQAAAEVMGPRQARLDILDAGCGTGLCGEHFKPFARRLVGVDLSLEMLRKAAARKLYDELIVGKLMAFVGLVATAWDVIVSAGTLVYFGDLAPVMAAARGGTAERQGGARGRCRGAGGISHQPTRTL